MFWLISLSIWAATVCAASTLKPPVLPLFVRSPYLSTWLPNARKAPWERWPIFYTGSSTGLAIMASVSEDSTVYPLLGRPQDFLLYASTYKVAFPRYLGATYDASSTNLTYHIPPPKNSTLEPVNLVLSFICPITPTSTIRQSIPSCYLSIDVQGTFDVSVYIDLNGEFVSGDRQAVIEWEYIESLLAPIKTWKIKKQNEAVFTEREDRSEWGSLYFSAPANVEHQSGTAHQLRRSFAEQSHLKNTIDKNFRSIMGQEPVFAFSKTFKLDSNSTSLFSKQENILFTISLIHDPVVQFASERGLTHMKPLWKSWFKSDAELIAYHYHDYDSALKLSREYSQQLSIDASKSGSVTYVDIVALSARQVLGGTIFSGTDENPLIFLKEISSDGNSQTVDVIFPSIPFFLYTNPRWLAYLLEPLIEHQLSGQYPNKYSMHDLGANFPNVTGHSDGRDEYMPVEECGNMLIMALSLANSLRNVEKVSNFDSIPAETISQDSSFPLSRVSYFDEPWGVYRNGHGEKKSITWLKRAYPLLKQWTVYLEEYTLEPHNQLSTDDFAGWLALHSNLALKGIVGINAMAEIAEIVGKESDSLKYKAIAQDYISKWQKFAIDRDGRKAKLSYNWYGSWTTLYSLYADALLCFHPTITDKFQEIKNHHIDAIYIQQPLINDNDQKIMESSKKDFIPHSIYTNQSAWYEKVIQKYGLPLDSRHLYTKSDWEFEAAAVAEPVTRKLILDRVATWINETSTDRPLTDLYETEGTGGYPGIFFIARPVVGGHFAFLALERAC